MTSTILEPLVVKFKIMYERETVVNSDVYRETVKYKPDTWKTSTSFNTGRVVLEDSFDLDSVGFSLEGSFRSVIQ